jgi:hypothetical protein
MSSTLQGARIPAALFAAGVLATLLFVFLFIAASPPQVEESPTQTIVECTDKVSASPGIDVKSLSIKNEVAEYCYRLLNGGYLLSDFKIRRLKFFQQKYDEVVMLWMVVIITLSGVVLAGMQLVISYNLSKRRNEGLSIDATEVTVQRDRVVFRSSITGLAILAISFAFFLVFVLEIYTIREINPDGTSGKAVPAETGSRGENPSGNGYGAPVSLPQK